MSNSSFFDKDMGWDKLYTSFETNGGEAAVFVGYLRSSGVYKEPARNKGKKSEGLTVAQIAAIHEFGATVKNGWGKGIQITIPERSFMRSSIDANADKLETLLSKVTGQVAEGKMSKEKALRLAGEFVKAKMVAKINSGVPPPLSEYTKAQKKSSKPLIDTGQLKNSIDIEYKEGK